MESDTESVAASSFPGSFAVEEEMGEPYRRAHGCEKLGAMALHRLIGMQ